MCMHVWALWLSCEALAALGPRGLHTTTRELQTCTPALQTPPKFNEKTLRERQKERKWSGRVKEKREIPPFGLLPSWPPHCFWVWTPALHPIHEKKNLNNKFQNTKTINSPKLKSLHTTKTLTLTNVGFGQSRFGPLRRGHVQRFRRTAKEAIEIGRDTTNESGHTLWNRFAVSHEEEVGAPVAQMSDVTKFDTESVPDSES